MKNEFVLAFNEVLEEKGLPKEIVIDALQAALASAYRRHVNASNNQHVDAQIDTESGKVTIYAEKEVVEDVADPRTEVSLLDAQKVDLNASIGELVIVETTPGNFGRVAAQTARQVIQQRIREAEREAQFTYFSKQLGEILSGIVQAVNSQAVTLGLEMKAEGQMPAINKSLESVSASTIVYGLSCSRLNLLPAGRKSSCLAPIGISSAACLRMRCLRFITDWWRSAR